MVCNYISNSVNNVVGVMVFNATFNNISVISWLLVLVAEETGVPGEFRKSLTNFITCYIKLERDLYSQH
jgi:hypothetical protein